VTRARVKLAHHASVWVTENSADTAKEHVSSPGNCSSSGRGGGHLSVFDAYHYGGLSAQTQHIAQTKSTNVDSGTALLR